MRIIIEDAATLEFLTPEGQWTKDVKQAEGFRNADDAKIRGAGFPIGRFNIVGSFSSWPQLTNLDEGFGTKREETARKA